MKKNEKKTPLGFRLIVDGITYGPFLHKYRKQYADLEHRMGVEFISVWQDAGWVIPPPSIPRPKKDKSTPLLDGIGFIPVAKG